MQRREGMTAVGRTGRAWVLGLALVLPGCGSGGGGESPPTEPAASPPPRATGLTAQAGDGEVALSWTAIAVAIRWDYRQRVGDGAWGGWTAVPGGGSATTGHTVTDLENGTAYGFQVRAANAGGAGPPSAEATATPVPPVPPAAEGLTATAGDRLVELSWTALGEASGWEYRMRIGDGAWGAWTAVPGGGPDTAGHTVTGLANRTAYGFQVRAANAGGAGPPSAEATATPVPSAVPVEIPDANLRRVLELFFGSNITDVELRNLTELRAPSEGIADLAGLEHATGLTRLELRGNYVSDLAPLTGLTSLKHLDLSYNAVVDLRPLSGLAHLTHLDLFANDVSDLTPLAGLSSLEHLDLSFNDVDDLHVLSGLTSLIWLGLGGNRVIADLVPLAGLSSLKHLDLTDNRVVDLQPLSDLTSLTYLNVRLNRVADVSALGGLRSLETLILGWGNPVSDVEPLSALTSLRRLYVGHLDAVRDLSFLSGMAELTELNIDGTSVEDLGPLAALSQLEILTVGETAVNDLSPLASLTSLRELEIQGLSVDLRPIAELTSLERIQQADWPASDDLAKVDISPVDGLTNLEELRASPVEGDLSPLAGLTSLRRLQLYEPGTPFRNSQELAGLSQVRYLTLTRGGLDGISPLADMAYLFEVDLEGNRIEDLAALGGLERLHYLDLDDNGIRDIAALAANARLGAGDTISLVGNPLGPDALLTHIPDLESRGVTVAYDRDEFPDSPLRMLHDEAVSMQVDADLDTVTWELDLTAYAEEFIAHFGDEFDVLLFLSALARSSDHANLPYFGVYHHVSNEVRGIGLGEIREPPDNAARLKGVIHFPWLDALSDGPSLHEIMHVWANYGVATAYSSHWGFSSAHGQLGGFRSEDLVDLGGGLWSAGRFGTITNGANRVRYSPWELYLGGFVGPEEVPDLWVAAEGAWTGERTEAGHSIFEAVEHETLTVDEFVETHGPREPDHFDAPKELRGAVIVLEDDDHQLHHWTRFLWRVRGLSHPGPHEAFRGRHNYHTATGGRGRLVLDGLLDLRRETPAGAPALRLEQVCPPPGIPLGADASSLAAPWTDFARPTLDNGGNRGPE